MKTKHHKSGVAPPTLHRILMIRELGALLALVAITVFLIILTEGKFLSRRYIFVLLRQAGELGIVAVPFTILIISSEFDLSIGSMSILCPVVAGLLVRDAGVNIWLAAAISVVFAVLLGAVNGAVTTKIGIPALITTLGTLLLYRAIAYILSAGWSVPLPSAPIFRSVFGGRLWFFPMAFVWFVVLGVCFWVLLEHTGYGNRVFATGGNREAARRVGLNTGRVKFISFILVAIFTAFLGLSQFAYLRSANPMTGDLLPLEAIAATVIGGTALYGGSGTVVGTVLGVFILAVVWTGLDLAMVGSYWKEIIVGVIIVLAIVVNMRIIRRARS